MTDLLRHNNLIKKFNHSNVANMILYLNRTSSPDWIRPDDEIIGLSEWSYQGLIMIITTYDDDSYVEVNIMTPDSANVHFDSIYFPIEDV